uniref:BTB domain-containing protein n=1 Tax=Megaselia scalaris TaxID=36166 RepID=T1GHS7_MEGSC
MMEVENQSFSAHRVVLASSIPYFYAMFTNNMSESRTKEITMKEIDPESLETLINFAYSGKIRIDNHNVQNLMVGASFLQLNKVRDACADFLIEGFHPNNVLGIRHFADSMSCMHLISAADKYINLYFTKVSQCDEFLSLPFDELIELIRKDELNVTTEETIFEACMRWIKFDEINRSKQLPEVLARVRLPLLSPQFLADRVATEDLIRKSHKCRDLLDEAKDFHLMPERRALIFYKKYYFSGYDGESNLSTVEVYDPKTNEWVFVAQMCAHGGGVGAGVIPLP